MTGLGLETEEMVAKPTATWRVPSNALERIDESSLETAWLRFFAWAFLLFGVFWYFVFAHNFQDPETSFAQHLEVFVIMVSAQAALGFLYYRLSNRIDIGTGLRRLSAKVPQTSACPVTLEIAQDGVVTGYDEGFLWLEDGTLFFKGLQTVFRLNAEDVPALNEWPARRRPNIDAGRLPRWIPVVSESGLSVRFKPIDPFEDHSARRRTTAFDKALTLWLRDRPPGSLETRLPPLNLHPSLLQLGPLRLEGLVAGVFMTLINLALLFSVRFSFGPNEALSVSNFLNAAAVAFLLYLSVRLTVTQVKNLSVRKRIAQVQDGF